MGTNLVFPNLDLFTRINPCWKSTSSQVRLSCSFFLNPVFSATINSDFSGAKDAVEGKLNTGDEKELKFEYSLNKVNRVYSIPYDKIIDIELQGLFDRMKRLGLQFKISPAAKDFLAEKGYDQKFGARPLKRSIQKYLEDPLAEKIIDSQTKEGDLLSIGFDKKKDEISIKISHQL